MTIVEELARFLARRLNLPFEDADGDASVYFGYMPDRPVKAVCVYADGLRREGAPEGTRVQIVIRSDMDGLWPIETGLAIMRLLDGANDMMFTPNGAYVNRVDVEKGFEFGGMQGENVQLYSADMRLYYCY